MEKVKQVVIKKVDLKKLRKRYKLSLRELGKRSGVNFGLISQFENGLVMTEETWEKISKVFDEINETNFPIEIE